MCFYFSLFSDEFSPVLVRQRVSVWKRQSCTCYTRAEQSHMWVFMYFLFKYQYIYLFYVISQRSTSTIDFPSSFVVIIMIYYTISLIYTQRVCVCVCVLVSDFSSQKTFFCVLAFHREGVCFRLRSSRKCWINIQKTLL